MAVMNIAFFGVGFACGGLFVLAAGLYITAKGPRACAFDGCTTTHWNLEKFCSHHLLYEDEEENLNILSAPYKGPDRDLEAHRKRAHTRERADW